MIKNNFKLSIITSSLAGGGAEKIAVNLANHYAELGYTIDLVTFNAKGEYIEQLSSLVELVDLKIKPVRFVFGLHNIFPLRQYLKNSKPDAVLSVARSSNTIVGLAFIFLNKSRVIFREANTMHITLKKPWYKKIVNLNKMRISYRYADIIIANSEDTKRDLMRNKITSKEKIIVIPNPVLPSNYLDLSNEKIEDEYLNDSNLKTVISVGRLVEQKNHELLIRSFKLVNEEDPKTRLLIIGQGKEKSSLIKLIEKLKLSNVVKIVGFKQNIFPYYRLARVFVLSSNWEGFGNVIVEALSLGKPVVCTNCPGGPKFILDNGKYGKLVPMEDEVLLAKAIIESLNSYIDQDVLINRSKQFTVQNIAEKYLVAIR